MSFEVGCIYRQYSKRAYYLAIDGDKLLSAYDGECKVTKPYTPTNYQYVKQISVEELCEVWDITMERLDEITRLWIYGDAAKEPGELSRGDKGRPEPYMPLIARILEGKHDA